MRLKTAQHEFEIDSYQRDRGTTAKTPVVPFAASTSPLLGLIAAVLAAGLAVVRQVRVSGLGNAGLLATR